MFTSCRTDGQKLTVRACRFRAASAGEPWSATLSYSWLDLHNFYALCLDSNMAYSCAYFRDASDTIDEAQLQKCDLICRKSPLKRGERFLDIGCGSGGLVRFACASTEWKQF